MALVHKRVLLKLSGEALCGVPGGYGLEPATVRRWFKKHHQMTFHAYQRMLRLNRAYRDLSGGHRVATTAFRSGYESLSGFADGFRATFGTSPSASTAASVIHRTRFQTPIGPMVACATDQGVCLCEFTDRRMLETEFADLQRRLRAVGPSGVPVPGVLRRAGDFRLGHAAYRHRL